LHYFSLIGEAIGAYKIGFLGFFSNSKLWPSFEIIVGPLALNLQQIRDQIDDFEAANFGSTFLKAEELRVDPFLKNCEGRRTEENQIDLIKLQDSDVYPEFLVGSGGAGLLRICEERISYSISYDPAFTLFRSVHFGGSPQILRGKSYDFGLVFSHSLALAITPRNSPEPDVRRLFPIFIHCFSK
jgi:hypothetical protein